jgi:hypothetical protein
MNSGRRANHNGKGLENFLAGKLEENGFIWCKDSAWLYRNRVSLKTRMYAKQVYVGLDQYGDKRIVDFFIVDNVIFPKSHIWEAKWQQSAGSIDEKFAHLRDTIRHTGIPTTVIVGGGGCRPNRLEWFKRQSDGRVFCAVWTMEELQIAVNNGFLHGGDPGSMPTLDQDIEQSSLWDETA